MQTNDAPPLRVLLVEDDEHDVVAFRRASKRADVACEVTHCSRAEEALERLGADMADASSFDIVVTDQKLPGMSGLDLFREIRKNEVPLPVVLVTGAGSEQLAVEALKAGVDDYIVKVSGTAFLSFVPILLLEVVRRHGDRVARKKAEEKLRDSEERFRVALKGSKITVFQQDRDLRYTWVHNPNPGLAVEDVVGNTDADLVPAEDATVLTGIKRRVLEKGVGENAEIRFSVGGEPFYYDITLEPLRGRSGDVVTTVRPRVCRD